VPIGHKKHIATRIYRTVTLLGNPIRQFVARLKASLSFPQGFFRYPILIGGKSYWMR